MDNVVGVEAAMVTGSRRIKALIVALLCVVFLLNLTGGWIEIPDFLPVIGNLDEVAATVVLMRWLRGWGGAEWRRSEDAGQRQTGRHPPPP